VRGASLDGGDGVGHGDIGVIVAVDAEDPVKTPADLRENFSELVGERAAVGVAEAKHIRAGRLRGLQCTEGESRAGAVTVKEMFGVEDDLFAMILEPLDGFGNEHEVLFLRDTEGTLGVEVPSLAENGDDRSTRFEQRAHVGVLIDGVLGETGGAESGQPGMLELEVPRTGEEFFVPGIGARPAAFDVVYAQLVQLLRDDQLIVHRERDGLALRAVS
jgi:hypothetical protein